MAQQKKGRRVTISLSALVNEWAEEMCAKRGFEDNFSAYVADLIRRDKDRQEEREREARGIYPPHRPPPEADIRVEERPAPKKKKPAA